MNWEPGREGRAQCRNKQCGADAKGRRKSITERAPTKAQEPNLKEPRVGEPQG